MKKKTANYALIVFSFFSISFSLIFNFLIKRLLLKKYLPYYFIVCKHNTSMLTLLFVFLCLFIVLIYFIIDKYISPKKYIIISLFILIAALLVTIMLSNDVWVLNKENISYNTMFKNNITVYKYDDISEAELSLEQSLYNSKMIYNLKIDDKENVKINILNASYSDEKRIFEFDEKIANKRSTIGEYNFLSGKSDEFNRYYSNVFSAKQQKKP